MNRDDLDNPYVIPEGISTTRRDVILEGEAASLDLPAGDCETGGRNVTVK